MHKLLKVVGISTLLLFGLCVVVPRADAQIVSLANNQNGCAANGNPA